MSTQSRRSSSNINNAYRGAKITSGTVLGESRHGEGAGCIRSFVMFDSGSNISANLHVGLCAAGTGTWEQMDDAWLQQM